MIDGTEVTGQTTRTVTMPNATATASTDGAGGTDVGLSVVNGKLCITYEQEE